MKNLCIKCNLIFVILATDFSLVLLIKGGALSGTDTYQSLVNKTFGFPGYLLLSVLQFLYPFIGKMNVRMNILFLHKHTAISE